MTSKISSVKLLKESMKRSTAFGALLLLGYFCYLPIGSLLMIQISKRYGVQNLSDELLIYGADNPFPVLAACAAAVILAVMQYAYLHNREKTDFYHSLAVRREHFFGIQYAAGVLIWLITYGINLVLFLLICAVNGEANMALLRAVGSSVLIQLVSFLLIYSLMILTMMLTGKIFAAIIGFAILCWYAPVVGELANGMMSLYFSTYSHQYGILNTPAVRLTPIYAVGNLMQVSLSEFRGISAELQRMENLPYDQMLGIFLTAVLISVLCVLLYRKRPSEAAGKTMAFSAAARVIKFLLVVPLALGVQVLLYAMTAGSSIWGVFGLLFGLVICSAVIEFVYTLDIREVFRDKKQLFFSAAVALAILAEFEFDLTGYDKWMPAKSEVAEVELEQRNYLANSDRSVYTLVDNGKESWYSWERNAEDEPYATTDMDTVYALLEHSEEFTTDAEPYFNDEFVYPLQVTWRMKNGTVKIRTYSFNEENMITYFGEIWDSEEYRDKTYPILKEAETLEELSATSFDGTYITQDLTEKQRKEFLEIFKKELEKISIEEVVSSAEISVDLIYRAADGTLYGEHYEMAKGVFPESIKLLKEYGYLAES